MKRKHIGSDFDEFLEEEGLLKETETAAAKRVLACQLERQMKRLQISKKKLAMYHYIGMNRSSRNHIDEVDN